MLKLHRQTHTHISFSDRLFREPDCSVPPIILVIRLLSFLPPTGPLHLVAAEKVSSHD